MCSKGYPEIYKKNIEIPNFNNLKQNKKNFIFHAGTEIIRDKIYAKGGRVLNFVTISDKFVQSRKLAIEQIKKLNDTIKFHLDNNKSQINDLPDGLYPGSYLKEISKIIKKNNSQKRSGCPEKEIIDCNSTHTST